MRVRKGMTASEELKASSTDLSTSVPAQSPVVASPAHGGRPRSESSRIALLEAAYGFMKQQPLATISTQQIAAKAGVSTATVYRWWPTKEALLVDSVLHVKRQNVPIQEDGTPLERLREHMIAGGKFLQGAHGLVAARLLAAIQDDVQLREQFSERFYVPHSAELMELVQQAVDSGELPPRTDLRLFLDMHFGACLTRLLMRHEPIHWSDFVTAFDLAVAGARAYWADDKGETRMKAEESLGANE